MDRERRRKEGIRRQCLPGRVHLPDEHEATQMTAAKTKAMVVVVDHTMVRSIRCRTVIVDVQSPTHLPRHGSDD